MKQKSKHLPTIIIILFLTSFITWLLYPHTTSKLFTPVIEALISTTTTTDTLNNYTTTTSDNHNKNNTYSESFKINANLSV